MSNYEDEMLSMKRNREKIKADYLKKIVEKENKIRKRSQELKRMIEKHTKLLLDELSLLKSVHLKEMEVEMEEIDRRRAVFRSFETYCNELTLKGSASIICRSVDELIVLADDLGKGHEEFSGRTHKSIEVSFQAADLREVLKKFNNNLVGQIKGDIYQTI